MNERENMGKRVQATDMMVSAKANIYTVFVEA